MERFFGYKLHPIINDKGEILYFRETWMTWEPLKQDRFIQNIKALTRVI